MSNVAQEQVPRALENVLRVMKSARSKQEPMAIWADDVKAVEDAIAALAAPVQVGVREMTDSEREQAYPPYPWLQVAIYCVVGAAAVYVAGVALFLSYIGIRAMMLGWV